MIDYILDASFVLGSILEDNPVAFKKIKSINRQVEDVKAEIYSLPLLPLEVANGLRFRLKDNKKALLFLDKFSGLPIKYFPLSFNQISEILILSYTHQTTVYDTSYHFLALLLDGIFLTCDEDYYRKAKELNHIELVK